MSSSPSIRAMTTVATALPIRFTMARASLMKRSMPRMRATPDEREWSGNDASSVASEGDEAGAGDAAGALGGEQGHAEQGQLLRPRSSGVLVAWATNRAARVR